MKLRNKKTGEIADLTLSSNGETLLLEQEGEMLAYDVNLADLAEKWEDYEEPKTHWMVDTSVLEPVREIVGQPYEIDKEIGNWFETKEEAEKAVEKLKAWKRLQDEGFEITHWHFTPDMHSTIGNKIKIQAELPYIQRNMKDLDLLFGGGE